MKITTHDRKEIERLKQENEKLKECYCNRTDCSGRLKDSKKYDSVYQEKEDYKSRCEKANKFIDNNSHYYLTVKHNEGFSIDLDEEVFCNTLLNILNGSDEK